MPLCILIRTCLSHDSLCTAGPSAKTLVWLSCTLAARLLRAIPLALATEHEKGVCVHNSAQPC
eukprot:3566040-Pleurochrysis_carterae.AAC.2